MVPGDSVGIIDYSCCEDLNRPIRPENEGRTASAKLLAMNRIYMTGDDTRESTVRRIAGKDLLLMAMAATVLVYSAAHRSVYAQALPGYEAPIVGQSTDWNGRQIQYQYFAPNVPTPGIIPTPGAETNPNPRNPGSVGSVLPDIERIDLGSGDRVVDSIASQSDLYGAPIESSGTWLRNGRWYTQQEFVILNRTKPRPIEVAGDTATRLTLSNNSATSRFQPGYSITVGRILGRDKANREHAIEVTYLGLFEWKGSASVVSPTSGTIVSLLGSTDATSPFSTADSQSYTTASDFNSIELNMLIRSRPNRDALVLQPDGRWVRQAPTGYLKTFFFGMRSASTNENFILSAVDGANSGTYSVITHNDMVGVQFGGELREQFPEWSWGIRGKFGSMVNFAERRSRLNTVVGGTSSTRAESIDDTNLVFLAEGNVYANYQVRPNLSFFVQYDIIYMTGLALAGENLGLGTSFPGLTAEGGALMQGMSLGFTRYW